jgi:hypothetical protein
MGTYLGFSMGLVLGLAVAASPAARRLEATAAGAPAVSAAQSAADIPTDPSTVGYLNLYKRHPDGEEGRVEFDHSYGWAPALDRLEQMRGFLASFRELTERVRTRLSRAELEAIGNTGWEMQHIGFSNLPLILEGTVLKQQYQLTQLGYELAQLKRQRGEAGAEQVDEARAEYREATRRFQLFWDTKRFVD